MYGVQKLDGEENLLATYGDATGEPFETELEATEAAEALEEGNMMDASYQPVELDDASPVLTPLPG